MTPTSTYKPGLEFDALIRRAINRKPKKGEHAAQRRSWILAEASMGSDADERAYCKALFENDTATLERLRTEAAARVERAKELLDV